MTYYLPFICLPTYQEHLLCPLPPTYLPTHLSIYIMAPLTSLSLVNPIIAIKDDVETKSHVGIAKNFSMSS